MKFKEFIKPPYYRLEIIWLAIWSLPTILIITFCIGLLGLVGMFSPQSVSIAKISLKDTLYK